MEYQGDYAEDSMVYVMFNTFTSDDPSASCTITDFVNTDVHIHKDDGLAQRNNAAGITVSVDFDGITGHHMIKIDTSDDTVGGFWVTGSDYFVRIEGTTVDGATINAVVGHFSIENRFNQTVVPDAAGIAATPAEVATALTTYDGPTKTEMDDAHALLTTPAQVKTQAVAALNTDTYAEPGQEAPTATTTLVDKIGYLFKYLRNKITNDGTDIKVYNDAGAVVDQKAPVSEVAGTVTRGEFISGP